MIQRCPNCGKWITAVEKTRLQVGDEIFQKDWKEGELIGQKLGKKLDSTIAKNILSQTGKTLGEAYGSVRGIAHMVMGDKFFFRCEACNNEWSSNNNEEDLTKVFEIINESLSIDASSEKAVDDYLEELDAFVKEVNDNKTKSEINLAGAYVLWKSGNRNLSLDRINKAISFDNSPNSHAIKGIIMGHGRSTHDLYKAMQELISFKDAKYESFYFSRGEFESALENMAVKLRDNFSEMPYKDRKYLVVTDYLFYLPDSFIVLQEDKIPTGLQTKKGYFENNRIYICHPWKHNYYIPIDEYKVELFEDQISELRLFLQSLGAKSLSLINSDTNEKLSKQKFDAEIKIDGGTIDKSGSLYASEKTDEEEYNKTMYKYLVNQEFRPPKYPPKLPNNLVWYPHMPEWKALENQYEMGNFSTNTISIDTKSVNLVSGNEEVALEADFKNLVLKGGLSGKVNQERMFHTVANRSWRLTVDFYDTKNCVPIPQVNSAIDQAIGFSNKDMPALLLKKSRIWIYILIAVLLITIITLLLL